MHRLQCGALCQTASRTGAAGRLASQSEASARRTFFSNVDSSFDSFL